MRQQRFPRAKLIRQCVRMTTELTDWEMMYRKAALDTTSDHLAGRFSGRAYVLEDVIWKLGEASEFFTHPTAQILAAPVQRRLQTLRIIPL